MEGTSVHRLTGAIDKNVHSGGHIWRFLSGGGGVLHIMAYMKRLRAKGISFLGFRYKNG